MFFSGNPGKRYEGAEVKHEIYFERPNKKFLCISMGMLQIGALSLVGRLVEAFGLFEPYLDHFWTHLGPLG